MLLLDGKSTVEIDVKNSHPSILGGLLAFERPVHMSSILDQEQRTSWQGTATAGSGSPASLSTILSTIVRTVADRKDVSVVEDEGEGRAGDEQAVEDEGSRLMRELNPFITIMDNLASSEVAEFVSLCESGSIYETLMNDTGYDRGSTKIRLFSQVLGSHPRHLGKLTKAFRKRWPGLLNLFVKVKQIHGYDHILMMLQQAESLILLRGVANRLAALHPDRPLITVHDSFLCNVDHADEVEVEIKAEYAKYGVTVKTERKHPITAG
jgi:hypothetical protein